MSSRKSAGKSPDSQSGALSHTLPTKPKSKHPKLPHSTSFPPPIEESELPPPLPKRNKHFNESNASQSHLDPRCVFADESDGLTNRNSKIPKNVNAAFLDNEINSNIRQNADKNQNENRVRKGSSRYSSQNLFGSKCSLSDLNINLRSPNKGSNSFADGCVRVKKGTDLKKSNSNPTKGVMVENALYTSNNPPPLPPRVPLPPADTSDPDAVNSINKQMSYPLVATCATLVNNYVSNSSF